MPAPRQLMPHHPPPVARAERFIGAARVVLAAGSLVAIWLDPSSPAKYVAITYALLSAYVVYAVGLLALLGRAIAVSPSWPLVTHVFDLACFGAFMYFTEGPTSPFFVYFIFSLVAATIRWHSRGALWTALAALALFLMLGAYSAMTRDASFEMNRFIIRGLYLVVAATLLRYLGRYQERRTEELDRIAAWAWQATAERRDVCADILAHAAAILRASRVILVFEEPDEPWVNLLASGGSTGPAWSRHEPDLLERLGESLGDAGAVGRRTRGGSRLVLMSGPRPGARVPLDERIAVLLDHQLVVTCAVEGSEWRGRLFAQRDDPTVDDVRLAEVVGLLAAARLDHMFLLQRLRDAAISEERMRLARDLHDGLLQSLAAAALEVKVAERLLEHDQAQARSRLQDVEGVLLGEQRELRRFIRQLKPDASGGDQEFPLEERLRQLAARVHRHWGLHVDLAIDDGSTIPPPLHADVYRLVHEALVNAARHAGATRVRVDIAARSDGLHLSVEDDGRGFSFQGTYDLPELIRLRAGPATLKGRVTSLGGSLTITSSGNGARVSIALPVAP